MSLTQKKFLVKEQDNLSYNNLEISKDKKQVQEQNNLDKDIEQESFRGQKNVKLDKSNSELDITQPQKKHRATNTQLSQTIISKKIESILEDDLEELYFKMDEIHRRIFKEEGEKTAHQIGQIISSGKSVAFKIIELIKQWLSLIPGINKFFIIQESKIKTDKIIQTFKH